jgi:tryptophan synthase alpha chain
MNRIDARFAALKEEGRAGLVTFIMAGDPDRDLCLQVLEALPGAGADLIELGMPFTDPMADGPVIQAAGLRSLEAGADMKVTLGLVQAFRRRDTKTPVILMGYYNPIYAYGPERFAANAAESGVDGLIIVDLPPEEDAELYGPARNAGLHLIRLVTPVTNDARLDAILTRADGFLYYVSITGITGTARADQAKVAGHIAAIRKKTSLPVAAGFGIRTPDDVKMMAKGADAVVVGSAIVQTVAGLQNREKTLQNLIDQVSDLAVPLRNNPPVKAASA